MLNYNLYRTLEETTDKNPVNYKDFAVDLVQFHSLNVSHSSVILEFLKKFE